MPRARGATSGRAIRRVRWCSSSAVWWNRTCPLVRRTADGLRARDGAWAGMAARARVLLVNCDRLVRLCHKAIRDVLTTPLEEGPLGATVASGGDVGAAGVVALPDRAAHRRRNVPGGRARLRRGRAHFPRRSGTTARQPRAAARRAAAPPGELARPPAASAPWTARRTEVKAGPPAARSPACSGAAPAAGPRGGSRPSTSPGCTRRPRSGPGGPWRSAMARGREEGAERRAAWPGEPPGAVRTAEYECRRGCAEGLSKSCQEKSAVRTGSIGNRSDRRHG
jgi:hypothetical protein